MPGRHRKSETLAERFTALVLALVAITDRSRKTERKAISA